MGLLPTRAGVSLSGRIEYRGVDLATMDKKSRRGQAATDSRWSSRIRCRRSTPCTRSEIRSPRSSAHKRLGRIPARLRRRVARRGRHPDPRRRANEYPHQFSGGMRQRADRDGIGARPRRGAGRRTDNCARRHGPGRDHGPAGTAAGGAARPSLITHDLGLVASHADRALTCTGKAVEIGDTDTIFRAAPRLLQPPHQHSAHRPRAIAPA